ncbi:MAG: zinc ribbon domain-containing protein [Gemmataceae bacterium]
MAKSALAAGWSKFRSYLRYKFPEDTEADEAFTTQTCSSCGSLPAERPRGIADLGMRDWVCSGCGTRTLRRAASTGEGAATS